MYYFMSDIHGNAKAYFALKAKIELESNDKLYILGNIFDGNSEHPEHCLAILDDIMSCSNISLILGEHEYAHVLFHVAENMQIKKRLEQDVINLMPSGKPLLEHMKSLPKNKLDKYISYLVGCEMTEMISIGKRYFYLVYGAPALMDNGVDDWQKKVVASTIDLKRNYKKEIETDPNVILDDGWNYEDTIIMCGGISSNTVVENVPEIRQSHLKSDYSEYQRVVLVDNKMIINCGCQGDEYTDSLFIPTLACVSVNPKGYSVTYKYDLFDA